MNVHSLLCNKNASGRGVDALGINVGWVELCQGKFLGVHELLWRLGPKGSLAIIVVGRIVSRYSIHEDIIFAFRLEVGSGAWVIVSSEC